MSTTRKISVYSACTQANSSEMRYTLKKYMSAIEITNRLKERRAEVR